MHTPVLYEHMRNHSIPTDCLCEFTCIVHTTGGAAVAATITAAAIAAATTTHNATLKQKLTNHCTPVVTSNPIL
jgi:hypothetical protein